MARAKRTDRTEARRRYRAEQAVLTADPEAVATGNGPAPASSGRARPDTSGAAPARPSFMAAMRGAFRPVDLRGDLRALPRIVTHWGVLAAIAASVASTVVFIVSTNDFAASLDYSVSDPLKGQTVGSVSNFAFLAVGLFVTPPPAAGAFLVGFTAPRASWMGGLAYGLVAAACYTAILLSPTGLLLTSGADTTPYIANAWVTAPLGAMLFSVASAWYKRFLNLANPNRGRKPTKAPQGRGNVKPNSRATAGRP